MCLILFSHHEHEKYKLIVAANRDEFFSRKTSPASYWGNQKHVLAGKDLEAGGTWMGITTDGKIGMLTNYRDLSRIKTKAPSRGHIVSDYLVEKQNAYGYMHNLQTRGADYNGFNFLAGDVDQLYYYGNYGNDIVKVPNGIHGLSNALLDTSWPKVKKGIKKMHGLNELNTIKDEDLFHVLYDYQEADEQYLPDTGVGLKMEKMLSPMFIKSADYGTRCSTIILVDYDNHVRFVERTFNAKGEKVKDKDFEWIID